MYLFKVTDKYVAVSAGYPWLTDDIMQAKIFKSVEGANNFREIFFSPSNTYGEEEWRLYEITFNEKEIDSASL